MVLVKWRLGWRNDAGINCLSFDIQLSFYLKIKFQQSLGRQRYE
jgi:hypothetical protein